MARTPMKEHETRALRMFIPGVNKIADITLTAVAIEPVILGDGSTRPLLRIEQSPKIDGKPQSELANTMWVDSGGQVLKAEQEIFGKPCVTFRTTREGAMAAGGPMKFNLISGTAIKTPRTIPNPEKTQYVKYRLTFSGGDLTQHIPSDRRQTVLPDGGQASAILDVRTAGPLDGQPGPTEVDTQYLKSNVLINSQDKRVVAMAKRATRGAVDPWDKARRINHLVFDQIKDKNFGVGFAAASEVARNLTGDCSEHAVLAAAMCRASGIPARVVVGLLYVDQTPGIWLSHVVRSVCQSALGRPRSVVGPVRPSTPPTSSSLETSLEGVAPFEAFVPIMKVSGKLEIEPLELR